MELLFPETLIPSVRSQVFGGFFPFALVFCFGLVFCIVLHIINYTCENRSKLCQFSAVLSTQGIWAPRSHKNKISNWKEEKKVSGRTKWFIHGSWETNSGNWGQTGLSTKFQERANKKKLVASTFSFLCIIAISTQSTAVNKCTLLLLTSISFYLLMMIMMLPCKTTHCIILWIWGQFGFL